MKDTKISWSHHTFNPWVGCQKKGPGCDNCYAESWAKRSGRVQWGPHAERSLTSKDIWDQPKKWDAEAARLGIRYRVFCASLADVFDNAVPPEWRARLFELIRRTPNLDWLLLTKRIGNANQMIQQAVADLDIGYSVPFAAWPWPNVWIGATVCNQEEARRDLPKLSRIEAVVRFVSYEPALGELDLFESVMTINGPRQLIEGLDWVIAGGESGPRARPMDVAWARLVREQCDRVGVAFHMKQLGSQPRGWCAARQHISREESATLDDDYCDFDEAHEGRCAGRCLQAADRNGRDDAEWPPELRVQMFPRVAQ